MTPLPLGVGRNVFREWLFSGANCLSGRDFESEISPCLEQIISNHPFATGLPLEQQWLSNPTGLPEPEFSGTGFYHVMNLVINTPFVHQFIITPTVQWGAVYSRLPMSSRQNTTSLLIGSPILCGIILMFGWLYMIMKSDVYI